MNESIQHLSGKNLKEAREREIPLFTNGLIDQVRILMKTLFEPGDGYSACAWSDTEDLDTQFNNSISMGTYSDSKKSPTFTGYFAFSAKHYLETGFLDAEDIQHLRVPGTQMLSVGSGPAHFERFLHRAYGVPYQNMTLSDIHQHSRTKNFPSPFVCFDMTKDWPDFEQQFDYILFPESLVSLMNPLNKIVDLSSPLNKKCIMAGIEYHCSESFFQFMKDVSVKYPEAKSYLSENCLTGFVIGKSFLTHQLILKSLTFLKKNGEVRMQGHSLCPQGIDLLSVFAKKSYRILESKKFLSVAHYQE
ncbi:MAG: hypothetical protein P1V18_01065 [Candidatus Gracilibacteria bacterium]|nr:hypothetical protein [Candidatus Gracilibacteria bacterium]